MGRGGLNAIPLTGSCGVGGKPRSDTNKDGDLQLLALSLLRQITGEKVEEGLHFHIEGL